ncbi:MAG TPA: cellulase family glycosylhydrolase [Actinocrinis sp.]|uniref:cellulase family glycosylhydrolase n=1 Tax=Actinocrinis sp. TaxID=1920516 RepID=UPI002DDCAD0D|nr:cellulase family glycosylhydrolase [Actinocrinis sp.]HEV2345029.1 cellulase family glycosylhydrolase [Actinocrinis sp.]
MQTMRLDAAAAARRRPVVLSALAVSAVLAAIAALLVAFGPLARAAGAVGAGYWHTSGSQILDSNGNVVRIAGVNWYGFETPDEIAHGLWAQDYHAVINDIKNLGYNTIRIPISDQAVETPVVPQNFSQYNTGPINTDLVGLNDLQILDKIVSYAGQDGLKVIIDNHRSEAGETAESNGLWYTSAYPSSAWVNDWSTIAKRYAGNSTVIGFDLRNEPHTPTGVAYASAATWGSGDPNTDIRLAYEQAGNAVLAADPNALVFCEGISNFPNSAASGGYDTTWWGGNLEGVTQYPVVLSSPGHVVYSAHDYGPTLFQQTWFNSSTTSASLDAVWNKFWGYIPQQNIAPLWVGEFGTGNGATDVSDSTAGSQGQWFSSLVSYIKSNNMSWTYWALNGEDSFALLDGSYDPTPVSAAKQSLLATIQDPLSGAGSTGSASPSTSASASRSPSPSASPSASASPSSSPSSGGAVSCTAAYSLTNSWAGGFQGQIVLTNTGTSTINGWTINWTFPGDQKINQMWTASYTQTGEAVAATNLSYNSTIAPNANVTIGFTGTFTNSDANPTSFTVNGTACH